MAITEPFQSFYVTIADTADEFSFLLFFFSATSRWPKVRQHCIGVLSKRTIF